MPIHDNKGRNPVPELGDTSGYYPDGKPPEPTQAEIEAFKAAMTEEVMSKVAAVEKDGNESRKRILREMARKLQRVESLHSFEVEEKKVDGVRRGDTRSPSVSTLPSSRPRSRRSGRRTASSRPGSGSLPARIRAWTIMLPSRATSLSSKWNRPMPIPCRPSISRALDRRIPPRLLPIPESWWSPSRMRKPRIRNRT